jgi:hypothetical protein
VLPGKQGLGTVFCFWQAEISNKPAEITIFSLPLLPAYPVLYGPCELHYREEGKRVGPAVIFGSGDSPPSPFHRATDASLKRQL